MRKSRAFFSLYKRKKKWYNLGMKNVFLILSSIILLASCNNLSKSSSLLYAGKLNTDKDKLELRTDFVSAETLQFSSLLAYRYTNEKYLYTFEISNAKTEQENVKVLLLVESAISKNYFFFGYDADYTIVTNESESNRSENRIKYLFINFSFSGLIDEVKVLYQNKDTEIYYKSIPLALD